MNKRNRILSGLLVLMLAGSLAGCSGGKRGRLRHRRWR